MNGSLLRAEQVAELLGVPTSWVYEQSRRGCIPTVALGRYRRYRVEAIAEWVESQEDGTEAAPTGRDARGGAGQRASVTKSARGA